MGPVRGCRVWRLHVADREGAVTRVFGERMRAGWVGAGEVRRDVGIDCFRICWGCCWSVGGLVVEWKVAALVRGRRLF